VKTVRTLGFARRAWKGVLGFVRCFFGFCPCLIFFVGVLILFLRVLSLPNPIPGNVQRIFLRFVLEIDLEIDAAIFIYDFGGIL